MTAAAPDGSFLLLLYCFLDILLLLLLYCVSATATAQLHLLVGFVGKKRKRKAQTNSIAAAVVVGGKDPSKQTRQAQANKASPSPNSGPGRRPVLLLRLSNGGDSGLLFFPPWSAGFQSGVEEAQPPLLGSQASRATAAAHPLLLLPALHQEIRRKDANGLRCRRRTLLRRPQGGRHRHLQDPQRMPSPSQQFGICLA